MTIRTRTRTIRLAIAVALAGLVAASLAALSPSASAAGFERNYVRADGWSIGKDLCAIGLGGPNEAWGVACFQPDGDKLNLVDGKADGKRIGMQWDTGERQGLCVNARGKEDDITPYQYTYQGDYGCNKNMPESAQIAFRVGRCDASKRDCTKLRNWGRWSAWTSWNVDGTEP